IEYQMRQLIKRKPAWLMLKIQLPAVFSNIDQGKVGNGDNPGRGITVHFAKTGELFHVNVVEPSEPEKYSGCCFVYTFSGADKPSHERPTARRGFKTSPDKQNLQLLADKPKTDAVCCKQESIRLTVTLR